MGVVAWAGERIAGIGKYLLKGVQKKLILLGNKIGLVGMRSILPVELGVGRSGEVKAVERVMN